MWLSDAYDIPEGVLQGPISPAFREFLLTWFGSSRRIHFGLPHLTVLKELTPEEIALGQQLVRRNLKCRYIHIINATWALRDSSAAPLLRMMLEDEPDESRRLVIAGALWRLARDPAFIECLQQSKKSGLIGVYPHLLQVLWLDDERAIDFLIDLLPERDQFARRPDGVDAALWALVALNNLEFGQNVPREQQHPPSHYRRYKMDPVFREHMLQAIHKSNEAPNLNW